MKYTKCKIKYKKYELCTILIGLKFCTDCFVTLWLETIKKTWFLISLQIKAKVTLSKATNMFYEKIKHCEFCRNITNEQTN